MNYKEIFKTFILSACTVMMAGCSSTVILESERFMSAFRKDVPFALDSLTQIGEGKLPFEKQMAFGDLEKDEELANKNLRTYYKSIGYIEVPGYNQMFLVPGYHNNKLESIDMDAPIQDLRK